MGLTMKWLVFVLLAVEAALLGCVLARAMASNLAVLLLAGNSVLLIWCATRLRRKPSCCR
jgi:hypothetical protein